MDKLKLKHSFHGIRKVRRVEGLLGEVFSAIGLTKNQPPLPATGRHCPTLERCY